MHRNYYKFLTIKKYYKQNLPYNVLPVLLDYILKKYQKYLALKGNNKNGMSSL